MSPAKPLACVGVACLRGDEVLLIKRGKPPREGEWSLPGGRIEFGETVRAAALRELREETGVAAEIVDLVDVVDALHDDTHFVLIDFAARWLEGEPRAGDDAREAAFVPIEAAIGRLKWEETRRIVRLAHDRLHAAASDAGHDGTSTLSR